MARRRSSNDEEGVNLDSLMDALTNVVAVLILVLILVQADVSNKVVEFFDGLEPATEEEVQAATEKAEALEAEEQKIRKLLSQEAPTEKQVEEERRQLALLEKAKNENIEFLANLQELKKLEEQIRKDRDAENEKNTNIQEEIAKLEALLDTSTVEEVPATVVSIPVSREIPKNAEVYYVLVNNGRIHFIDPFTPMELFQDEFKRRKRDLLKERVTQKGKDRYIYDQTKLAAHFKDFDFKNSRNQSVTVLTDPTRTDVRILIRPDMKEGGTLAEELDDPNNTFTKILQKLRSNSRAVLLFNVHPNSFDVYLAARRITDKARISAGWQVSGTSQNLTRIEELEVNRLQDPPPPDPDKKPRPPGPPPVGPKLD